MAPRKINKSYQGLVGRVSSLKFILDKIIINRVLIILTNQLTLEYWVFCLVMYW